MKRVLALLALVLVLGLAPLRAAHAAPPPDGGRITGVVSSSQDAALLPCRAATTATTATTTAIGAACHPKKAARWSVDQVDDCWLRQDVTTGFRMMGTCVLAVDAGSHVLVWAPLGAVEEDYRLIWEG